MNSLLPCPFCGQPGELMHVFEGPAELYFTGCPHCQIYLPQNTVPTQYQAIVVWNTRYGPGKPFVLKAPDLIDILVKHGLVQPEAVEDPEYYDGGITLKNILLAAMEISESAHQN